MKKSKSIAKKEEQILRHPQEGKASEFYWACRNGNIDRARELIRTIPFNELNRLEPNGSTPLHAASYHGNADIVRLLLNKYGCRRDHLNRFGLTAFEEARDEEIRRLFYRPNEVNRFCEDENVTDRFELIVKDDDDKSESIKEDISDTHLIEILTGILRNNVVPDHPEYRKCLWLINQAFKERRPEYLLRLYTIETSFYRALSDIKGREAFVSKLRMLLEKLAPRYFQGVSYRGVQMTNNDLNAYRWAYKNEGIIRTKTFFSTSLDPQVAESFTNDLAVDDHKKNVLMIFNFSEKCDTAINLGRLSPSLSCISEYENEAEVLLLPNTLFRVKQIESFDDYLIIYLDNVPAKGKSIFSALKSWYHIHKEKTEKLNTETVIEQKYRIHF